MGHPRQDSWASVVAQLAKNFHFCWGGYGLCLLALVLKVSLLWGGGRRLDCSSLLAGSGTEGQPAVGRREEAGL